MTPCTQQSPWALQPSDFAIDEAGDIRKKAMREAAEGLVRRRDQKIINALGQYLGKESLSKEDLVEMKGRLTHTVDMNTKNESYYIDDHLLVTFLPPEFSMEGTTIMVKQGYGPVGV
jgi:hypothetical protein